MSEFAASLSVEVRNEGIDVLAVHPSPVSSNFFDKAHKLDSLEIAKGSAVSADTVPAKIFSCIGRCTYGDLGKYIYMMLRYWHLSDQYISMSVVCDNNG